MAPVSGGVPGYRQMKQITGGCSKSVSVRVWTHAEGEAGQAISWFQ